MKKVISTLLVFLIFFNIAFHNSYVYADPDNNKKKSDISEEKTGMDDEKSEKLTEDILQQGSVDMKNDNSSGGALSQSTSTKVTLTFGKLGASVLGTVTGILARLINVFALPIDVIIGNLTQTTESGSLKYFFTIERAAFNRIPLFNVNYFNYDANYNVGTGSNKINISADSNNLTIKNGIVKAYTVCKLLALTLALLVLIFIGIRMALSTVASDKAKYKKMLISWIESVLIIFLMPYIISFIFGIGEGLTNVFYSLEQQVIRSQESGVCESFEDTIREKTLELVFSLSGLEVTKWSIVYWILLFMEIKFFWLYIKRLLVVGLLITVSPLITITYSIDKAGDGKAQVFSAWMQEFLMNVWIQPLHALLYLVIVTTANEIAIASPIIAIALLMAMGTAERMIKVIFNLKLVSLRGVSEILKKG